MNEQILENTDGKAFRNRFTACILLLVVISGVILWVNYSRHFDGFMLNDYHEYCQIARNFSEGKGYSTSVLRPVAYQFFQTLPQPEVTRMPLYPFFLSLFFRVFGPSDDVVVLFNSIFYIVLIILIFLLAHKLSGSLMTSLFAALMTAFMESNILFTVTAEPNIFYAAAFAGFFYYFLLRPDTIFIHGILLGVLHLIRANTMFVMAGFFVVFMFQRRPLRQRVTRMALLTAGILTALLPYMIRNWMVTGKPLFSLYAYSLLLYTGDYPLYTVWTKIESVNPVAYALSHPSQMLEKSYQFFRMLVSGSVDFYKPLVLVMMATGVFVPFRDSRMRLVKWVCLLSIVIQTVLLLPVGPVPYYYMFFFPVLIAAALANANLFLKRAMPGVLVLAAVVFIATTIPYWKSRPPENYFREIGRQMTALTAKDDIILTDIPWEVTWYADRRTIWLPFDIDTLEKISSTLRPRYILLTGPTYAAYGDRDIWRRLLNDPTLARSFGYELFTSVQYRRMMIGVVFRSLQ